MPIVPRSCRLPTSRVRTAYHHRLVRAGIVGFAASGKKTLFSLLTQVAQVGFAAGAKRGVLAVPDQRLETLARLHESKKTTPATVEVVLIPALRRGASGQTENLAALREVDAIVHAVRRPSRIRPSPRRSTR